LDRAVKVCVAVPPVEELYPYSHICTGLKQLGLNMVPVTTPLGADVLVTWSPWKGSRREAIMLQYKERKLPIIVMENGWLSPIGDEPYFQVQIGGWNGTGYWTDETVMHRWRTWGVKLKPWRTISPDNQAFNALVVGQRGHPLDNRTAPPNWHREVQIDGWPKERIVRRDRDCGMSLTGQLSISGECHVWTSNVASWAIIHGVPVVQHGPNLMAWELASKPGEPLARDDREPVLERLAWAQWNKGEIASGEPFARALECWQLMQELKIDP
jgi:hypothetical protein